MSKQLVSIVNRVNPADITRMKNGRGDEIIVVPSKTLPDNVVMNGGLYPAAEIEKGYQSLEGKLSPIGHPFDEQGNYISANEADAINYFHGGAVTRNVKRVAEQPYGHRVHSEIHINVKVAQQSEQGRRLLDAINRGDPINTSTGVLLNAIPGSGVTANGKKYEWIATNLEHDHNAILLDEDGAATPADGVGIFVNHKVVKHVQRDGQTLAVHSATAEPRVNEEAKEESLIARILDKVFNRIASHGEAPTTTREGEDMSMKDMLKKRLGDKFEENMSDEDMLNAYGKMMKGNAAEESQPQGEQSQPGEAVVNEAVSKLIREQVEAALAANKAAQEADQRKALAEKLKVNGVELDESDLKTMSVNALQKMVEKTTLAGATYLAGGQMQTNSESRFGDELPE